MESYCSARNGLGFEWIVCGMRAKYKVGVRPIWCIYLLCSFGTLQGIQAPGSLDQLAPTGDWNQEPAPMRINYIQLLLCTVLFSLYNINFNKNHVF